MKKIIFGETITLAIAIVTFFIAFQKTQQTEIAYMSVAATLVVVIILTIIFTNETVTTATFITAFAIIIAFILTDYFVFTITAEDKNIVFTTIIIDAKGTIAAIIAAPAISAIVIAIDISKKELLTLKRKILFSFISAIIIMAMVIKLTLKYTTV